MKLRPLPPIAADLLAIVGAQPRLVAHLTLVHDVALQLVPAFQRAFPALVVDEAAVLFGAATIPPPPRRERFPEAPDELHSTRSLSAFGVARVETGSLFNSFSAAASCSR
jgi:hypothetical protein